MHERSIYQIKKDFYALGQKYPYLEPFVMKVSDNNDATINFQNKDALSALAKALLMDDFGLDVDFLTGTLIPRIPSRLDYILWIEDLIHRYDYTQHEVNGIDIGTGSSAIYALLAARKNKWKMIGTEKDEESLKCASDNIERNKLADLIKLVKVTGECVFTGIDSIIKNSKVTFTMCNPPYFGHQDDIGKRRNVRCPKPSGVQTGTENELKTEGGEVQLIVKMIEESRYYAEEVLIFTSMVGVLRHLKVLREEFWKLGIYNFYYEEYVCGKMARWYIAWSFDEKIVMTPTVPDVINRIEFVPRWVTLEDMIDGFLKEINIVATKIEHEDGRLLHVVAYKNTWSKQRRLKREKDRQKSQTAESEDETPPKSAKFHSANGPNPNLIVVQTGLIQPTQNSNPNLIVVKTDPQPSLHVTNGSTPIRNCHSCETLGKPLVDVIVKVSQPATTNQGAFQLTLRGGLSGRDGLYQVNQYLAQRYIEKAKSLQPLVGFGESLSMTIKTTFVGK